ncbi:hypothetical protein [Pedococcus sp. 5OH_020]|uniref:hypothetical protein n=1 Tax=Pedococcus sp. 5OH_020 TaxID=2989814 RepID=UPI0022EA0D98|nr:hypothetical protein [Pedococcus sp. 5OH_020]
MAEQEAITERSARRHHRGTTPSASRTIIRSGPAILDPRTVLRCVGGWYLTTVRRAPLASRAVAAETIAG